MINAVLDGRKTQTRRVVKPQPWGYDPSLNKDGLWEFCDDIDLDEKHHIIKCPYGKPGSKLWVRETFNLAFRREPKSSGCIFRADYGHRVDLPQTYSPVDGWKPSIFMPRWASRITLEITDIRVERVADITPEDAKAEGDKERSGYPEFHKHGSKCHVHWFKNLWDSINAKRKDKEGNLLNYSWADNPYVWIVEFRKIAQC